jgi:hypothetical protein
MHTHSMRLTSSPSISISGPVTRIRRRGRALLLRCVRFLHYCADQYAAAAQFDELSKLSDVGLERCGIAPGDLHRHLADSLSDCRNSR